MDDQTRTDAARAYYAADSAFVTWIAVSAIVFGVIFTAVGVLVDLRSGVWGTLIFGIVLLLVGIGQAVFGPRIRAMKRRQIGHLFNVDKDQL